MSHWYGPRTMAQRHRVGDYFQTIDEIECALLGLKTENQAGNPRGFSRKADDLAGEKMGKASLKANASLEATDISVDWVRFCAEGNAKVLFNGVERLGEMMVSEENGKIERREGAKRSPRRSKLYD